MSELSIRELQAQVEAVLGPIAHPRVGAALALSEECGEVSKLVLEREVYGQPGSDDALAGELCDVLVCAFELANRYGIDLQKSLADKLADLALRAPKWSATLGPGLEAARARMDPPPA